MMTADSERRVAIWECSVERREPRDWGLGMESDQLALEGGQLAQAMVLASIRSVYCGCRMVAREATDSIAERRV